MLERLRGASDPIATLSSVPGIGPVSADRLYHDPGLGTLEDLEAAAHDGRRGREAECVEHYRARRAGPVPAAVG